MDGKPLKNKQRAKSGQSQGKVRAKSGQSQGKVRANIKRNTRLRNASEKYKGERETYLSAIRRKEGLSLSLILNT